MVDNQLIHNDVAEVRDEIVKKINSLVSSKTLIGGKRAHESKSVINNLRHQISKISTEKEGLKEKQLI